MNKDNQICKVLFRVPEDDGSANVETLNATRLEDDLYQLDNSPFFAYSVSWNDIIYAPYNDQEQMPAFKYVSKKSGHRTIRVIFDPPVKDGNSSEEILQKIVDLGCSYEGANPKYICIDIPPDTDLMKVRQFMIDNDLMFEHADPTDDELFQNEDQDV